MYEPTATFEPPSVVYTVAENVIDNRHIDGTNEELKEVERNSSSTCGSHSGGLTGVILCTAGASGQSARASACGDRDWRTSSDRRHGCECSAPRVAPRASTNSGITGNQLPAVTAICIG